MKTVGAIVARTPGAPRHLGGRFWIKRVLTGFAELLGNLQPSNNGSQPRVDEPVKVPTPHPFPEDPSVLLGGRPDPPGRGVGWEP